ncbi:MAG: hypothetical protein IJ193_00135 [Bacilli bacterium]|nr:hypothetical protein [Bacilli bacterium]
MIKKQAKILDYNPVVSDFLHTIPIEINDSNKLDSSYPTVYFDAAFSRQVVKNKSDECKFVFITENKEQVYFIYDPENFTKETNYDKFNELINSQKESFDENLEIYSGLCVCIYNPASQSINVFPVKETKISDPNFKII